VLEDPLKLERAEIMLSKLLAAMHLAALKQSMESQLLTLP